MQISLIGYNHDDACTITLNKSEELTSLTDHPGSTGITWIIVESLDKPEEVNRLAEIYKIHPLTVEDILESVHQRPKVEEFDNYLFISFKAINVSKNLDWHHISLVVTKDTVLTFQEKPGAYFDGIRKRIMNNAGKIRRLGSDFLAYTIMDAVVDEYFVNSNLVGSEIEEFEDRALDEKDEAFIMDIQAVKRKLLTMRRAVWPLRESISMLIRLDSNLISAELEPFLKDLHDNTILAAETVESYRELLSGIMEIHMTGASNRLNKVIKVLTIISTIFIPLTFIAGIYGMNFDFMPELNYAPAYFICLGFMALTAIGMLLFFKHRKWL